MWRDLSVLAIGCALFVLGSPALAQAPKTPAEIEAELMGKTPPKAAAPVPPAPPAQVTSEPTVPAPAAPVAPAPVPVAPAPVPAAPNAVLLPVPEPGADARDTSEPCGARCQEIDDELSELTAQQAQAGLGLPIAGMVAGYAGGAFLTSSSLGSIDEGGTLFTGLALSGVAMLGVGIASHIWLRSRVAERRDLERRLLLLRLERPTLIGSTTERLQARARLERAIAIERELDTLRREYSQFGLAGPIVTMSVGFALAVPLLLVGLVTSALGDTATPFVVGGLVSLGVGIGGAAWLGQRKRARKPLAKRIRALQGEERALTPVSFDVHVGPNSASLGLQLGF